MSKETVEELAAAVKAMKGSDRLRLAAELLDRGQIQTAAPIVQMVADDLALGKLVGLWR